ncbi:MAG: adenylate kinase [Bacteroidota bacterium]|nr:adenylate kinase [Bacteroidota bacterium]
MKNLIFFGAPGAGKGTQAKKLETKLKLKHISTGDVLRAEISNASDLGQKAEVFMNKGELVPDKLIIRMVEKIISQIHKKNGFILDGFPRTIPQAVALDEMLKKYNISISDVLFLDVPKETLIGRLQKRAKIEKRNDDKNVKTIENRIEIYKKKTKPVFEYYANQDKFKKINGVGNINEIYQKILLKLSKL